MRKRAGALILLVGLSISSVLGSSVELAGEGFIPEPNQEITVQIQTDTPLFAMDIGIYVIGDANITTAMCEADCNEYGWDNGWNSDPYIDPNGWVEISGVRWDADANGTVGYFKFRYNSGQVIVYIDQENSLALGWDGNSCPIIPLSTETLVFGQPDPNDCNEQDEPSSQDIIPDENIPASTEDPNDCNEQGEPSSQDIIPDENTPAIAEGPNDVNIPSNNYWQDKEAERQKHLRYFPADFNSSEEGLSRAEWEEQLEKDGSRQMLLDGEPNVIDINSDITSNQIWTANNIYCVTAEVNVTALLVIEPGTVITFSNYGSMSINNGGALISCGTPNEPIYYTSAYTNPDIGDYYCAIYVKETASPATKVTYSYIEYAYVAIVTNDIRLDTPIENNIFFFDQYSIREYGTRHSDIINNLVCESTIGIDVHMASSGGEADKNSHILIGNNTCYFNSCSGIRVHGTMDANNAGQVTLVNNIVSATGWTGISLGDGWMCVGVTNTGYYANTVNIREFNDINSVEVNECPYVPFLWTSGCYLKQNCPFINAGLEYVEETPLIGMTTDYYNSLPDSNKVDLGFHHPNWGYWNAGLTTLRADFNNDFVVDYNDLYVLADYWLFDYDEDERDRRPDLYPDGRVNFRDFAILANEWGKTSGRHPEISVSVSGDVNSLNGEAGVGIGGCLNSTAQVFIFMDGQLMGETDYREDEGEPGVTINTPSYRNGSHLLKGVIVDYNGIVTVSEKLDVNFNNPVHCLSISDTYEPNQPVRILGFNAAGSNLNVELTKWGRETIWSQQVSGSGNLDLTIPSSVLDSKIYDLSIEQEIGGMLMLDSSWEMIWKSTIAEKYEPNKVYEYGIFLPNARTFGFNSRDSRKEAVAGIIYACNKMNIPCTILYGRQCTWDNFARVVSCPTTVYAYVVSRGAGSVRDPYAHEEVQRTYFFVSGGEYVFSHFEPEPGEQPLGRYWEERKDVHYVQSLGISPEQYKIVWIDVCFNGTHSDMANAWMSLYPGVQGKLYVSWNTGIYDANTSCFAKYSAYVWGGYVCDGYPDPNNRGFGLWGKYTYQEASNDALNGQEGGCPKCADLILGKIEDDRGDKQVRFMGNSQD